MAEVQDEEQWLYGDDKDDSNVEEKEKEADTAVAEEPQKPDAEVTSEKTTETPAEEEKVTAETNGAINESIEPIPEESQDAEQNGEKAKDDAGEDSSSDDEPTITIGKIVKQPDILRPPPPTHRAAPTSGLKDDDFNTVGKVNGIPITDFNLAELEEKPWRKPGADLSDYFNYGFMEDTWIKYCERQKAMRTNESGIGLTGLGINVAKGMLGSSNIPVSIVNENSKYGSGMRKPAGMPLVNRSEDENNSAGSQQHTINTIQVMTADRRTYSNKVMGSGGPGGNYDDMDFGGHPYGTDFFSAPPPSFYTPPPPGPWGGGVPNVPPPGWMPDGMGVPPPLPPHHRGGMGGYFDEDSLGPNSRSSKDDRDLEKMRDSRDREHESRERESRHHSSRRRTRSRSQSKSRHRKRASRTRSRSRSPSHRHKRKKSKREREMD